MAGATVGFCLIVVGYVLAGAGAALLYFNSPPEIVPDGVTDSMDPETVVHGRAKRSHYGFGLLMLGSVFQLAGVIVQWAYPG